MLGPNKRAKKTGKVFRINETLGVKCYLTLQLTFIKMVLPRDKKTIVDVTCILIFKFFFACIRNLVLVESSIAINTFIVLLALPALSPAAFVPQGAFAVHSQ